MIGSTERALHQMVICLLILKKDSYVSLPWSTMTFPYSTARWGRGFFKKTNLEYFLTLHSSYSYFVSIDFNHSHMFINGSLPCCERELLPSPKGTVFIVKSIIREKEVGLGHCHWLKSCSHQKSRTAHGTHGKWWTARISTGEIFQN